MSNYFIYNGHYVFHPGYYIEELVEYSGCTQEDFARRIGTTPKNLSLLIRGEQSMSIDIAVKLARYCGSSPDYWLNLQSGYDAKLALEVYDNELNREKDIYSFIDFSYLCSLFNLEREPENIERRIESIRDILHISSLSVLREKDLAARFRGFSPQMKERNIIKANIMLLIAVNEALREENVPKFDRRKFGKAIESILPLTIQNLGKALPAIRDAFFNAGVVFVVLPNMPGSMIYGGTKKLKGKVLLFVSDRYKTEDSFWFTLLHEVGHIIKGDYGVFYENSGSEEKEANRYAEDKLIPPESYWEFFSKREYTRESVINFAQSIGRSPGIVVSRLQKDNVVSYSESNLNSLKKKYKLDIHLEREHEREN